MHKYTQLIAFVLAIILFASFSATVLIENVKANADIPLTSA